MLLSSGIPSATVTIGGLAVGSTHTYAVAAVAANSTSPASRDITITTLKPQPAANFHLTALTSTSTSVAWDPSPGPVSIVSYSIVDEIYSTPTTGTVEANVTGITGNTMSFQGQTPGTQHYYFLYAYDAAGNASAAAILGAYNPPPTPAALSGPAPVSGGGFQFTIQTGWARTTLVQATTTPGDPASWLTIATNPPTSSAVLFTDTNANLFPTRFYRIVAP